MSDKEQGGLPPTGPLGEVGEPPEHWAAGTPTSSDYASSQPVETRTSSGYEVPAGSGTGSGSTTGTAKEQAGQVTQDAKEAGRQVVGTAVAQGKDVLHESQRQVKDLTAQARQQASEQTRAQKDKAASGLRSLADELSMIASGAGGQRGVATDLAQQAAAKIHDVAGWLEHREPGELVEELRGMARRRPGTFLLGALAAGVAAGRLTRGAVDAGRSESGGASPGPPSPSTYQQPAGSNVDLTTTSAMSGAGATGTPSGTGAGLPAAEVDQPHYSGHPGSHR